MPLDKVVNEVNATVRGWVCYFHYRNFSKTLQHVRGHVEQRLRTHLSKRHKVRNRKGGYARFGNSVPKDSGDIISIYSFVAVRVYTGVKSALSAIPATIQTLPVSYDFEDVRVMICRRLKNMSALFLAASFFATVRLGTKTKLEIPAMPVMKAAKRIFG